MRRIAARKGGLVTGKRAYVRTTIAALGLLASVFAVQLASPGTALARCRGVNDPVPSTMNLNGSAVVSEYPNLGTCNNNNSYGFAYRSNVNNWRASVWIQNNGHWSGWYGGYNKTLNHGSYGDTNSHSYMHFCLDNGRDYYCGWGNNVQVSTRPTHTFYGVNQGF
jgi:hypothetical protein